MPLLCWSSGFLTLPLSRSGRRRKPVRPAGSRTAGAGAVVCLVFAAGALYFGWSWTGGRRTLPMKTWRLRLVRTNGTAPPVRTALVRYVAAWIGPALALLAYVALRSSGLGAHALWLVALNYLWAFVDPDRQFLHDRVAGTRIVDDRASVRLSPN